MFVSDEHRFVFIAIPHNASTSVIDWLRKHFPDLRKVGGKHGVGPTHDYFSWCVFRQHDHRLRAMYRKQTENPSRHLSAEKCRPAGVVVEPFDEWLKAAALYDLWALSQQQWLLWANHVVCFEELPKSLLSLPFVTKDMLHDFPHHNARTK